MRLKENIFIGLLILFCLSIGHSQSLVKGFIYESGNRGYISDAKVTILDANTNIFIDELKTNEDGLFVTNLPIGKYTLRAENKIFFTKSIDLVIDQDNSKYFPNIILDRKPGYIFDITVALRNPDGKFAENNGGLNIEVYNNTTDSMVLDLVDYASPDFQFTMEQGNHYSYMIRKAGYYTKRMEAYVNVKGCILCFDGVGSVRPGITDNLTEGLKMGTLLANIELKPVLNGESIKLKGVHFNKSSARLKSKTIQSLDGIAEVLKSNPQIIVEIAAHSDSRGDDDYNLQLSDKRARAVVEYLVESGVHRSQLMSKGYGETRLLNKCRNNVPCSDADHAKNRRVEFAVVQSVNTDNDYSLRKIKEEERMAKLLDEVLNQDVVQIGGEAPIPKDLEKVIGENNADKDKSIEVKSVISNEKQSEPKVEDVVEEKTVVDLTSSPVSNSNYDSKSKDGLDFIYVKPEEGTKQQVSTIVRIHEHQLGGYMVRLGGSDKPLDASNDLLSNHGIVYEYIGMDGHYNYLVGLFELKENAQQFLDKFILKRYPKASIILIEK